MLIDPFKATTDAACRCDSILAASMLSKIVLLILFVSDSGVYARRQIGSATCPTSTVGAMMNKTTILFRDDATEKKRKPVIFSRARARLVT